MLPDLMTLDFLKNDQAKLPWRVEIAFRPNDGTPSYIRQGLEDGHEVIVNRGGQAITAAPFKYAHAIVQCINFVHSQARGNPPK
jgi:hypothetical protein